MGNKKIALLLAIVLAVTAIPTIGFAADETGENVAVTDIEFLQKLGIFKGYEDNRLHPEYNITRMEYAALIMRCFGIEADNSGQATVFSDVDASSWGSGYVNMAYDMGLIEGMGDGRFAPDENITEVDAVKILVTALGRRPMAEAKGGYPAGYLVSATSLDIIKSISVNEKPAKRSFIAQIIVNSLEIEIDSNSYENKVKITDGGMTILDCIAITVKEGMLTGTRGSNILNDTKIDNDEIMVANEVFKTTDVPSDDFLGRNVLIYVKNYSKADEIIKAVLVSGRDIKTLQVDAENIDEDTTLTRFKYVKNNKVKDIQLGSNIVICYNGSIIDTSSTLSDDRLKPQNGFVRLVDTDDDGNYDLAIVKNYKTYVVKTKDADAVYDIYGNKLEIDSVNEYISVSLGGESAEWEDIKIGDVLCAATDISSSKTDIIICRDERKAVVTSKTDLSSGTEYTLDGGNEYKLSYEMKKAIDENRIGTVTPEIGKSYLFKFNTFGEISAATEKLFDDEDENSDSFSSSGALYGFLLEQTNRENAMKSEVGFRFLSENNTIESFFIPAGEKVKFGRMESGQYVVSRVRGSAIADYFSAIEKISKQIFKYAMNNDNIVKEFYLEDETGKDGNFKKLGKTSSAVVAYNTIGHNYYFDENTVVFSLPALGMYEEQLSSGTPSDYFSNNSTYNVQLWDVDKGYVPCIAYITQAATTKYYISEIEYYIDYVNSPVMLVTDVRSVLNDDGDVWKIVEGWEEKKKVKRLLSNTLSNDSQAINDIKPGAVIQYTTNKEDLVFALYSEDDETIQRYSLLCDLNDTSRDDFILYDYDKTRVVTSRIAFGISNVERMDYPYIRMEQNGCLYTIHDGTRVYKYNAAKRTMTSIEPQNIAEGAKVFFRTRYSSLREVVVIE